MSSLLRLQWTHLIRVLMVSRPPRSDGRTDADTCHGWQSANIPDDGTPDLGRGQTRSLSRRERAERVHDHYLIGSRTQIDESEDAFNDSAGSDDRVIGGDSGNIELFHRISSMLDIHRE